MIEIRCKYEFLLFPKEKTNDPFRIVKYRAVNEVTTPDGKSTKRFSAMGEFLPLTSINQIVIKILDMGRV